MKSNFAIIASKFRYVFLLLIPWTAVSQKLDNIVARGQGNQVIIEYQLSSTNQRDRYEIAVYASHDNFATPLAMVQGDVGRNVYPGTKRITWEAKNELKTFNGTLTFEVRGRLVAGVLTLNQLEAARRGKDFDITWKGGVSGDPVRIDLLDAQGNLVQQIASGTNNGSFTWAIPPKTQKGDYKIQITHQNEKVASDVKIKSKVPFAFKVLPVVVVGALVPFLIPDPNDDLPTPPGNPQG